VVVCPERGVDNFRMVSLVPLVGGVAYVGPGYNWDG